MPVRGTSESRQLMFYLRESEGRYVSLLDQAFAPDISFAPKWSDSFEGPCYIPDLAELLAKHGEWLATFGLGGIVDLGMYTSAVDLTFVEEFIDGWNPASRSSCVRGVTYSWTLDLLSRIYQFPPLQPLELTNPNPTVNGTNGFLLKWGNSRHDYNLSMFGPRNSCQYFNVFTPADGKRETSERHLLFSRLVDLQPQTSWLNARVMINIQKLEERCELFDWPAYFLELFAWQMDCTVKRRSKVRPLYSMMARPLMHLMRYEGLAQPNRPFPLIYGHIQGETSGDACPLQLVIPQGRTAKGRRIVVLGPRELSGKVESGNAKTVLVTRYANSIPTSRCKRKSLGRESEEEQASTSQLEICGALKRVKDNEFGNVQYITHHMDVDEQLMHVNCSLNVVSSEDLERPVEYVQCTLQPELLTLIEVCNTRESIARCETEVCLASQKEGNAIHGEVLDKNNSSGSECGELLASAVGLGMIRRRQQQTINLACEYKKVRHIKSMARDNMMSCNISRMKSGGQGPAPKRQRRQSGKGVKRGLSVPPPPKLMVQITGQDHRCAVIDNPHVSSTITVTAALSPSTDNQSSLDTSDGDCDPPVLTEEDMMEMLTKYRIQGADEAQMGEHKSDLAHVSVSGTGILIPESASNSADAIRDHTRMAELTAATDAEDVDVRPQSKM